MFEVRHARAGDPGRGRRARVVNSGVVTMTEQFVAFRPQCNDETVHKACFVPEHSDCVVCLWCRTHHPQVAGRPGEWRIQPVSLAISPEQRTCHFSGGVCSIPNSFSFSLFSCLARLFSDR